MLSEESLRPRKKPAQSRSRFVVDSILEAVTELCEVTEQPPTVQAIADRAGVSIGSLYQYFPTKESVLSALIDFNLKRALTRTEHDLALAASAPSPEAAARLMVRNIVACNSARRRIEHALFRYFVRVGDLSALTMHDDRLLALLVRFLEALGPAVRPVNHQLAAFVMLNALRSVVVMSIVQQRPHFDAPEFEDELVRLVLAYLRPA